MIIGTEVGEVSLPGGVNTNGYITSWFERIILPSQPLAPRGIDLDQSSDDDDDVIVVQVDRKDVSA